MEPSEAILTIGADGHDGARVEADLRDRVARKTRAGAYAGAAIPAAGRIELPFRRRTQSSNAFFLRCLREAARVDICDFEIRERRARLAPLLVRLKRAVWSLLRFYTYRLWSQQNEVNSLLVTGIESVREECTARTEALEARVAALEQQAPPAPPRATGASGSGESA
jgi:hypothetical protein